MFIPFVIFKLPDIFRSDWNLKVFHHYNSLRICPLIRHYKSAHVRQRAFVNRHPVFHHGGNHANHFICCRKLCRLQRFQHIAIACQVLVERTKRYLGAGAIFHLKSHALPHGHIHIRIQFCGYDNISVIHSDLHFISVLAHHFPLYGLACR